MPRPDLDARPAALVLASPGLHAQVQALAPALALRLWSPHDGRAPTIGRAAIVVVEHTHPAFAAILRARATGRLAVPAAAVVGWWSDDEPTLHASFDALLHAPPRVCEWAPVFARLAARASLRPAPR
jgi:hypothetical protein